MKLLISTTVLISATLSGCATLTNDANVPIAFSMSDGSTAQCAMDNKRGNWSIEVPATAMIRRSDDALRYVCTTKDGRTATGSIPSKIGAKIVASAVFIDFGITDPVIASYLVSVDGGLTLMFAEARTDLDGDTSLSYWMKRGLGNTTTRTVVLGAGIYRTNDLE